MVGRLMASQIASASAASFLPRLTYGLASWRDQLHLIAQ
jgi:hypothetical protein